eukprot:g20.t1
MACVKGNERIIRVYNLEDYITPADYVTEMLTSAGRSTPWQHAISLLTGQNNPTVESNQHTTASDRALQAALLQLAKMTLPLPYQLCVESAQPSPPAQEEEKKAMGAWRLWLIVRDVPKDADNFLVMEGLATLIRPGMEALGQGWHAIWSGHLSGQSVRSGQNLSQSNTSGQIPSQLSPSFNRVRVNTSPPGKSPAPSSSLASSIPSSNAPAATGDKQQCPYGFSCNKQVHCNQRHSAEEVGLFANLSFRTVRCLLAQEEGATCSVGGGCSFYHTRQEARCRVCLALLMRGKLQDLTECEGHTEKNCPRRASTRGDDAANDVRWRKAQAGSGN